MAFPTPAANGQTYTSGNYTYVYNATLKLWSKQATTGVSTGNSSVNTAVTSNGVSTGNSTSNTGITANGVHTGNSSTNTGISANGVNTSNGTANTAVTANGVSTGNSTSNTGLSANGVVTGNGTNNTAVTANGVTTGNGTHNTAISANGVTTGNGTNNTAISANGVTTGNATHNTAISANGVTTSNSSTNTVIKPGEIKLGDATINSTAYTGTANNSLYLGGFAANQYAFANTTIASASAAETSNNAAYLGGVIATEYVTNTQLSSNLLNYQTTTGLSANVAKLAANSAVYVNGKTEINLNVNNALTANNSSYLNNKSEDNLNVNGALYSDAANNSAFLNHKTEINLNVNNALTANNSSYLNNKLEADLNVNNSITSNTANTANYIIANTGVVSNSYGVFVNAAYINTISSNNSSYLNNKSESNLNVNNALTANNSSYLNSKSESNLNVNSAINSNTANTANYIIANTGIVSNATGVFVNAAYINTISSNNSSYLNSKSESNLNVNNALTANNSSYLNTKAESNLNVNNSVTSNTANTANYIIANTGLVSNSSGVFVNAAYINTVSSNNSYYLNNKSEINLNVNNSVTSNTANTANLANYIIANTGIVSNSSGVFVNAAYINTVSSNNSYYLNQKPEANLNVNSALTANSSAYLGDIAAANYAYANLGNLSETSINKSLIPAANNTYDLGTPEMRWNKIYVASNTIVLGDASLSANAGAIALPTGSQVGGQVIASLADIEVGNANTANFIGDLPAANVVSNAMLQDNLARYATLSGATFSGIVNANAGIRVGNNSYINVGANTSIDFDTTTYKPTFQKGRMYWDNEEQTIVVFGDGTSFEQTMGQREWVRARNSTSSTITKGTPVYITGVHIPGNPVHGHHPTIAPGDASDYTKSQIVGLAGEDIIAGAHGYVVVRGYVEGLDTSALTSGQRAHLGFATPGTIVQSAPEYPNYPTDLGMCLTADATNGTFYVDLAMHTAERFRTTQDMYVGGGLSVGGDLSVTGNIVSTSATNLSVSDNIIYVSQGDTISPGATTFTGSGLNDMSFHGVFEGTSSIHYYVKIDTVGATDKFSWSKDNFATTIASGISITGNRQALDNGISVQFNAITGHTLNNKWDGTGAPVNVDLGWVGNYNDGVYRHTGLFRDASDGVYKFFEGYTPQPDVAVNIDTGHASFKFASIQANVVTANLAGTANNASYLGGIAASSYQLNSTLAANVATLTSNNSSYLNTKAEEDLNVNNALTANNSAYLNTKAEANLNVNNALTANNSSYLNTKAEEDLNVNNSVTSNTANYIIANTGLISNSSGVFVNATYISSLATNSANTANLANYIIANTGIVSNATGVFVNAAYINTISANASTYLNGKTESNLNVNSAVNSNSANNASYLNNKTESNLNVNSALTANNTTYVNSKTESNLNVNNALTANNSLYLNSKSESNLNVNNSVTSNTASYIIANTGLVSNSSGVFVDATYIGTLSSNNSSYLNNKTESNLNVNSAINANNSSYLNSKSESNLNVNSALTANIASYIVANTGIVSNASGVFVNAAYITSLATNSANTANLANYIIANTGLVSNSSGVFVNAAYINTISANAATYLNGKTEINLNVNNALTANNASYLNAKLEADLNVNSAVVSNTANNASYLNNKTESNLNVNNALSSNNSSYLNSKLENDLNVNNAVYSNTANNSSYLNNKTESNLNVNNSVTSNTANTANYIIANTGLVSNSSGVFVNSAYINTISANAATYLNGKTESNLNVNSALISNNSGYLNNKTESNLNVNNSVTSNTANYIIANTGIVSNSSGVFVNAEYISSLSTQIVANTGIVSNTSGVFVNSAYINTISSNNAYYLNNKTESNLNVNSAVNANNSSYLNNKLEADLNVNSAITSNTANNASYLNNKTQINLNVNNALTANSSSYLNNKTESNLNVNSSVTSNTANNSSYLNNKTESNLNVNSAITSNTANTANYIIANTGLVSNATGVFVNAAYIVSLVSAGADANNANYLNNKIESNLNVNSAVNANSANNASYLGTIAAANYVTNTDNYTLSGNLNFTGTNNYVSTQLTFGLGSDLIIANGAGIQANGAFGGASQVLTSDGNGNVYWSTVSSGTSNIVRQKYIANGTSNTFTVSGGYVANTIDVYMNGVKLQTNIEANVQSGSTFTILGDTPTSGTVLEVIGLVGTPTVDYTKYVKTFNITGLFSALVVGVARYVPLTNTTITTVRMTNGSNIVGADLIAQIYKNGVLDSTYTLTAGNYTRLYTNAGINLTTSDYLTVNISQGVGNNFSFTISN